MKKFEYANLHEWLCCYVTEQMGIYHDKSWWKNLIMAIAHKLDPDDIQDIFQKEMEADDYFEEE